MNIWVVNLQDGTCIGAYTTPRRALPVYEQLNRDGSAACVPQLISINKDNENESQEQEPEQGIQGEERSKGTGTENPST